MHFISTVAVVGGVKSTSIQEDVDINLSQGLENGYVESKWVGEQMVHLARSRGIPCNIFRLPRISGDSTIGAGPEGDFLWRLIQASLILQTAPKVDLYDDLTPVDFVCEALREISTKPEWINTEFHIASPKHLPYLDIFKWLKKLGYPLKLTDFSTWKKLLVTQSIETNDLRLQALASLLADADLSMPTKVLKFGTKHLQKALKGSHLECPKVDEKLFTKYVDYYVKSGFLPGYK